MTTIAPTPIVTTTPFGEQRCKLCRFYYKAQDGDDGDDEGPCCRYPEVVWKKDREWCGEFMDKPAKVTP